MAQNKLFDDITPAIKQALQLRKKKLIDRSMDEFSKTSYVRAVPVLLPELTAAAQKTDPDITLDNMLLRYTLGIQPDEIPAPSRSYGNKYNRPDAGITELSVEQQGFSGKGLVKIQLKGVINTLEQIDYLKPVLLTPGRYWLFEWGYTPARTINLSSFFNANTNKKFEICEKHRKETEGNSEAQIAVVDGYEYSMLESGAFSFDVSFIGSSTLFKRFTPSTEGAGFTEVPDFQIDAETGKMLYEGIPLDYNQAQDIFGEGKTIGMSIISSAQNAVKNSVSKELELGRVLEVTKERSQQAAFTAATPKNFFEKLKEYILDTSNLSNPTTFGDYARGEIVDVLSKQTKTDNPQDRDYSSFDSIRKYGVYYDGKLKAEKIGNGTFDFNEFNNEIGPYVTWGWMEDNILSVVYGNNESDDTPMKIESTDENGLPLPLNSHRFLYTSRPDLLIIPGRMPTELERRFDNDKTTTLSKQSKTAASLARFGVINTDEQELNFDEAFLSYHPIVRKYLGISERALGFDEFRKLEGDGSGLYDGREDDVSTEENKVGSIRRLVLHYSMIKESFLNASTAQEGLLNLFKKVEGLGYTGFWNFGIFEVDNKIGCYERNSLTETGRKALEIAKDAVIDSSLQTDTPPPGVPFVFPTFNNDGGFVLQQNLTVKMPTGNMLAMVYGNTLEGRQQILNKALTSDSDGLEDFVALSNDDWTPPEKIKVRPGFQSGNIAIITSINLFGQKQFAKITPENVIKLSYKNLSEKGKKDRGSKVKKVVGKEAVKVVEAFDKGLAYDANGIMYSEFQRNMNLKLQKKFMQENGVVVEITGNNSQVLDMVELRLKILGIAGLDWGDMFHTDYIEERYKKETLFYITKIEHQVTENKWTTDIVGGMRAVFNSTRTRNKRTLSSLEKEFLDIQLNQADKDLLEKLGKVNESILVSIDNRFVYEEEEDVNQTDTTNQ